jgi:hypothetical protein
MFYSIEVSSLNTAIINDIVCGEFASLADLRSDAWYRPDVMREHVETWNAENPFYKISYTVDATYEDVASISLTTPAGRTISFTFGDDGLQYPGGAVGTFTIDFGEKGSGQLALNILQNLEYYDCLDQIDSIKTSLPFEEV